MKIKKHGNLYKSVKCPVCGCEFEYSIYETKTSTETTYRFKYIECPECYEKIREESWLNGLWS